MEEFSLRNAAIILAFFPAFYLLVEIIDRLLPTPRIFEEDMGTGLDKELGIASKGAPELGSDFGPDVFGNQQRPQQQWQQQKRKL